MVESSDKQRTSREISNANLIPFVEGQSGNPLGRPKDRGITSVQKEMLDLPCPYAKDPKTTWRKWLAERGLVLASEKEMALEHLKERLEGKVRQDIGLEGDIPINIIYKLKENDAV